MYVVELFQPISKLPNASKVVIYMQWHQSFLVAVGSERRHSAKAPVYSVRLAFQAVNVLLELVEDETITRADKVDGLAALHAKWSYKDVEEPVEGSELLGRQRQRCNAIGPIVFGFTLHKEQIDAIGYLFYEQTDLILLGKTGLGKSLIFQLLPFMSPIAGVVLILCHSSSCRLSRAG